MVNIAAQYPTIDFSGRSDLPPSTIYFLAKEAERVGKSLSEMSTCETLSEPLDLRGFSASHVSRFSSENDTTSSSVDHHSRL
jgi:hypothetical protein